MSGAGYVGTVVVRRLLDAGAQVVALTRNPSRAAELAQLGATAVVADLADDAWHAHPALSAGAELIVNCVSAGGGGLAGYQRSYVDGMHSLLRWSARVPAATLVYTSSTSVYAQDGGVRVTEADPVDTEGPTAALLLTAERALRDAVAQRAGGRAFVLRLAGIYGPGRHHLLDQLRAGSGEVAGRATDHLNLIHRDDAAAAVLAAACAPAQVPGGVFNLADDGAAQRQEVMQWLAAQLGRPLPQFTGQPASGRRARTPDRIIDNTAARTALGWRPLYPTFREGYAAILAAEAADASTSAGGVS